MIATNPRTDFVISLIRATLLGLNVSELSVYQSARRLQNRRSTFRVYGNQGSCY